MKPRIKTGKTPTGNDYVATRGYPLGKETEVYSHGGRRKNTKLTSTRGMHGGGQTTERSVEKRGKTPAGRPYTTTKRLLGTVVKQTTSVTGRSVRQTKESLTGILKNSNKVSQRLDGGGRTKIKKGFTTK